MTEPSIFSPQGQDCFNPKAQRQGGSPALRIGLLDRRSCPVEIQREGGLASLSLESRENHACRTFQVREHGQNSRRFNSWVPTFHHRKRCDRVHDSGLHAQGLATTRILLSGGRRLVSGTARSGYLFCRLTSDWPALSIASDSERSIFSIDNRSVSAFMSNPSTLPSQPPFLGPSPRTTICAKRPSICQ